MKINSTIKNLCLVVSASVALLIISNAHASQAEQAYTTAYRYNLLGQVTGVIKPDPDGAGNLRLLATRNTYSNGLLVTVENGELSGWADETTDVSLWSGFAVYLRQIIGYDSYGRKTSTTTYGRDGSALSLAEYNYDEFNRVKCTAVRMAAMPGSDACTPSSDADRVTRTTYNDYNQIVTEERAVGTPISQTYVTNVYDNSNQKLTSQYDANGNRTDYYYGDHSLLRRVVYPSPSVKGTANGSATGSTGDYVEFVYDNNGNKTHERKRNGSTVDYTVDNNNRVTLKHYSNTGMQDIAYNYDLRGLQTSAKFGTDAGRGIANSFDGFGNIISSTNSIFDSAPTLSYNYDLNNNRINIQHPDGVKFNYSFDGLNRINKVSGSMDYILNVIYGPNGQRKQISRFNGTTTDYAFDNGVQLNSFSQTFKTPENNFTNSFVYNKASQITELNLSNKLYYYQGNDNITGTYTPDGLNRYAYVAGQAIGSGVPQGYDFNGNLTNDGTKIYSYDDENRLIAVRDGFNTLNATLSYDPMGRLFQTNINGKNTRFIYDGDALVLEYEAAITRRYVHGDRVDEPWIQYNGISTGALDRIYLHTDHQGSLIAQTDSNGKVKNILSYDTYGIPASSNVDRFGYTGQILLKELDLNYYKARMYAPKLGRFLQTDPIGYKDQMNLYAYVGNDPLNLSDSTGQCIEDLCIGEVAVAAAVIEETGAGAAVAEGAAALAEGATVLAGEASAAFSEGMAVGTAESASAAAIESGATSGATTGLVTAEGEVFTGASTGAGGPGMATNSEVAAAVAEAPKGPFAGCCGEINAMSKALNAGAKLEGAIMATVRATGRQAGKLMEACPTCKTVANQFGVKTVSPK